jgi:hypothetical protein
MLLGNQYFITKITRNTVYTKKNTHFLYVAARGTYSYHSIFNQLNKQEIKTTKM